MSGGEAALENKKKPGNPLSKYERRKELTREEQLEYQVELLKRGLMKKAASDITYIKYCGKWFYLVCYLDLFNNEIVEWQLSDSFDNLLVIQSAKRLLEKAKCTGYPILLHSDQGNQYTSAGCQALLREFNAIQSMSRAGTPRDNAVMESFFGRFMDVLRFQFLYWECDNLNFVIEQAVHYFNYERPVRKLNGKPPIQFRIDQIA